MSELDFGWEWSWDWGEWGWGGDFGALSDNDDIPDTRKSSSLMNAAGRLDTNPFRDLRSASHAHRRTKKFPRKKSSSRSKRYCCPICRPAPHLPRLARRVEIRYHIQADPWHDDNMAIIEHDELLEFADDMRRYELFGYKKSQFENYEAGEDGWVQGAEDFSTWGRRRIDEMRAVKEDRVRRRNNNNITPSPAPAATTLPTTPSDIRAHYLLDNALRRFRYALKSPTRGLFFFPPFIRGYSWFGEYKWQWHRNRSGCWEIGYAYEDCKGETLLSNWVCLECSCKDFALDEPAPEEMQRCSLVEWVKGSLWDVMVKEEYQRLLCQAAEDKHIELEAEEWEMMSNGDAASEGWSVIEVV